MYNYTTNIVIKQKELFIMTNISFPTRQGGCKKAPSDSSIFTSVCLQIDFSVHIAYTVAIKKTFVTIQS